MAVKEKLDSSAARRKKRLGQILAGVLTLTSSYGGYMAYDDVYIPHVAQSAIDSQDYDRYLELLPRLDADYNSRRHTIRALQSHFAAGNTLDDELFQNLIDHHQDDDILLSRIFGLAVLYNNTNQISKISLYPGAIIDFDMPGADLSAEEIRAIHEANPYPEDYALSIMLQASVEGKTDIANWFINTFDFENSETVSRVMRFSQYYSQSFSHSVSFYEDILDGITIQADQQLELLTYGRNNAAILEYALSRFEYSEDALHQLFINFAENSGSTSSFEILLQYYTPSEDAIAEAYDHAINRSGFGPSGEEMLLDRFPMPQETANKRFLDLVEHDYESRIVALIPSVSDETLQQSYIHAARHNSVDSLFTLDVTNISFTQETIDEAFLTAAREGHANALRHITSHNRISDDIFQAAILALISEREYNNTTQFARELQELRHEYQLRNPSITRPNVTLPSGPNP